MMQLISFILILALSWNVLSQDLLQKEFLLSSPRTAFTSVEVDGKIYLAGGLTTTNQPSSTIDVFDIATQTWNSTLSLPSPRFYVTPAVVSPHIYFLGGWEMTFTTAAYQYDAGSDSLQKMPELGIYRPIQISLHGSTLVLLGSNQAKFLQLTKTGDGWITNSDLDNLMMHIAGTVVFNHENLIFMFGGVNVSSRQPLTDAWLFDIDSSNLTHYENAINPIGYIPRGQYSVAVTNNIMTATNNVGDYVLFNINTSTWLNITIMNATNALSVPGFTFIFTSSGYYTVDWSNPRADPVFSSTERPIVASVAYQDHLAYFVNYPLYATMYCFDNGAWTPSGNVTLVGRTVAALEWPSNGYVFATFDGIYLFNNCNVKYTPRTLIQGLVLSHPVPDQLYATVKVPDTYNLYKYNSTLALMATTIMPFIPQLCFNNILFDFSNGKAFSTLTPTYSNLFTNTGNTFNSDSVWFAQGNNFFVTSGGVLQTNVSDQLDIYNYQTGQWLNSTTFPYPSEPAFYNQAFNMDDKLTVFTSTHRLTFDVATDQWDEQLLDPYNYTLPGASISPMVVTVEGIAYTTTDVLRLRIVNHGVTDFSMIADKTIPLQIIHNKQANRILISTTKKSIYTWNIDDQQQGLLLFSRATSSGASMATSGSLLLISYGDSDGFDYYGLVDQQTWNSVPGITGYIHPSVMTPVTVGDKELILIAGGQDKSYGFYSNSVRLIDLSSLETVGQLTPGTNQSATPEGLSQDNATLIVAIVVPVGAVLIAGALVAFFLIRRQKKKKNRGNRASVIGLENQYGQWLIPFSDLTFHEQLGQGGSGQVFKGSWKNTSVALKLSMTQANNSVISELSLMMQLRPHPNVVQLLGFSVHPETDSIVLVLEYCNQGALDELLFNDKTSIPLKQKLEWLIGISKGLSHLHSNNIVHRDVAARNVLLHQNEAKLTDFGMSRIVDDEQQRGTTKSELGPIRWMSPESLKRKEYSTKSDVWSFGIVAFEIIAQQEPHVDKDPIQVGQEIRDSGLTPHLPDTCPSELALVIKSCWHMEPSQRPTFEHIIAQLESVMSQMQ